MAYTLKSNATTAAASLVFVGENGLTNLVDAASVTQTGTVPTGTVSGRTVYGDGVTTANNYLEAAVGAVGTGKFAVLLVAKYNTTANDDCFHIKTANTSISFGTGYSVGGGNVKSYYPLAGNVAACALTGYTHPNANLHVCIYGRDNPSTARLVNYWNGTRGTENSSSSADDDTISAGNWKFSGRPSASPGSAAVGLFAVFHGIGPQDLADAIAAAGGGVAGAYDALLQPEAAASDLTGSITLADLETSGSLASNVALLTGDLSIADVLASGALGLVPGSIRTLPFARNNGTRPTGLINVAVAVLSDDASLLRLAGSTAIAQNGDGTISFSGAGLPGVGASVIVITREPDGKIGAERYLVT